MRYEIYLDVVFGINFVMDYIMLSITDRVVKCTAGSRPAVKLLKCYASASVGAVWVCMVIALRLFNPLWNAVTYILVCAIMIVIMTGVRKPFKILKGIGMLYLTACLFGGFVHVIYYYTAFGHMLNNPMGRRYSASIWHIAASAALFTPIIRFAYHRIAGRLSMRRFVYRIDIEQKGDKISLPALCDTGNSLTDPYNNGEPVNIINSEYLNSVMGEITGCGYHLIPFNAIGTNTGVIPVVRLDRLTVYDGRQKKIIEKPLFALYSGEFTAREEYRAIIHPAMMGRTKG